MSYRPKAFPHPVASPYTNDYNADVLTADFELQVEPERGAQALSLGYSVTLDNTPLEDLVVDQQARVYLDIESVGTRRRLYERAELSGDKTRVFFDDGLLNGTVRITPIVVAHQDIEAFRPEGISHEFGQATFDISRGSLLGIGLTTSIEVDFEETKDSRWVRFALVKYLLPNQYRVDLGQPKIAVHVGETVNTIVNRAEQTGESAQLFVSIFKDVFRHAITALSLGEEPEKPWEKALSSYLNERGIAFIGMAEEDIELLAQQLVGPHGFERLAHHGN